MGPGDLRHGRCCSSGPRGRGGRGGRRHSGRRCTGVGRSTCLRRLASAAGLPHKRAGRPAPAAEVLRPGGRHSDSWHQRRGGLVWDALPPREEHAHDLPWWLPGPLARWRGCSWGPGCSLWRCTSFTATHAAATRRLGAGVAGVHALRPGGRGAEGHPSRAVAGRPLLPDEVARGPPPEPRFQEAIPVLVLLQRVYSLDCNRVLCHRGRPRLQGPPRRVHAGRGPGAAVPPGSTRGTAAGAQGLLHDRCGTVASAPEEQELPPGPRHLCGPLRAGCTLDILRGRP
mmetsp:Transcript_8568/g.24055  ORF Transcript_8568/g.24055 Transcript_8568/m.24055 type:complete len:285 (+) Transcript_8568:1286-2140(+)